LHSNGQQRPHEQLSERGLQWYLGVDVRSRILLRDPRGGAARMRASAGTKLRAFRLLHRVRLLFVPVGRIA